MPAFISARWRKGNMASRAGAQAESRIDDTPDSGFAEERDETQDNVFALVPPTSDSTGATGTSPAAPAPSESRGRNVHPIGMSDLGRISIDNDGRLYWDGKPVEVRRRIMMSRTQVIVTSAVATFLVIGAIGAAVQGTVALRDWACRLGWTTSTCTLPAEPGRVFDIPA